MEHSERVCQLCGIGFNIGRIRQRNESESGAWSTSGRPGTFAVLDADEEKWAECEDCEDRGRRYSFEAVQEGEEHLAGWGCRLEYKGYSGCAIGAEEMRERTWIQCLYKKDDQWEPEPGDEDHEITAKHCFVTGISKEGVGEFDVEALQPVKHGVRNCMVNNIEEDPNDPSGLPMHPACFEIFKRMSIQRFGIIDVDGLWLLRRTKGGYPRFVDLDERKDVILVREQQHRHVPGTEYLATNPVDIPELTSFLETHPQRLSDVVFKALAASASAQDPFQAFPPELCAVLLELLGPRDVANLRLSSKAFSQLPQTYFKHLIKKEMPWVWELHDIDRGSEHNRGVDWYTLWNDLWIQDGGFCADEEWRAAVQDGQPIYRPFKIQIKGLRNRRMIYGDISIILDMMAEAQTDSTE